jgi:hypothetical protein
MILAQTGFCVRRYQIGTYDLAMRINSTMLAVLLFPVVIRAATFGVTIIIEDGAGDALKDELVIVQDLNNHEHELLRTLCERIVGISCLLISGLR